jgi:putative phosphotransacetylase
MSRPIPIEIVPSHIHLSEEHQVVLFGVGMASTITHTLAQSGQFAYAQSLEVFGKLKRSITLRVLGPYRQNTQVELTPTEAALLGLNALVARSGDASRAATCRLVGPAGEVMAEASVIIPQAHLHCSDTEAASLHLTNGKIVEVEIIGDQPVILTNIIVRVHPSYRLRLHIHPDIAREYWISGVVHGKLRVV